MSRSLEHWDGDGLPESPDDFIEALALLPVELDALYEGCKREAWVREQLSKHEDKEGNIAMAGYFWRRAQRWKELAGSIRSRIDAEGDES